MDDGGGDRSWRFSILLKLLVAFITPSLVLFALFGYLAHEATRQNLEDALGERLSAVAASAATQIRAKYVSGLQDGDSEELFYRNALRKLEEVREATGVARFYIFGRDFLARVDTKAPGVIGNELYQAKLDRVEVEGVFDSGNRDSSVLFEGSEGLLHKAGYAPLYDVPATAADRQVVLVVGADAPAAFFAELHELRNRLLVYGAMVLGVMILVAVVFATLLTKPVRKLAVAAERIGQGKLSESVDATSRDEIGVLARTMDKMRMDLFARDERMRLMLAGIAHEVRNPLAGMTLFAGSLREELPSDDARAKHVQAILRELGHLERVVEGFLGYARRAKVVLGPVELRAIAEEAQDLVRPKSGEKGLKVTVSGPKVECLGDRTQLRQLLLNLLTNAVDAAPSGTEIAVVTERGAGMATVLVENEGEGLSEETLGRIFEPFFTTKEKGSGLGLALAKEIANDHGGALSVSSDQGKTTFRLQVPTKEPVDSGEEAANANSHS